jgi:hypothetical protein
METIPPLEGWLERIMKPAFLLQALALVVVLGLSGCASAPRLPAYITETETITARGEPTARLENDDGTKTLQYATQPKGTTCLMVQVDAEGWVVRIWDALDAANLRQVKPGLSKDEVSRMLGSRLSERTYPDTEDEVWEWNIRHHGHATSFNVYFSNGLVKYTRRTRIYPEGAQGWRGTPYIYPYPYPYFYGGPWFDSGRYRGDRYRGGRYRGGGGGIRGGRHRH